MPRLDDSGAGAYTSTALPTDVASLFDDLAERLNEPGSQERWYPGASVHADTSMLPYYGVPPAGDMTDLLEAALIRPPGDFDFADWLLAFERSRKMVRTQRRRDTFKALLRVTAIAGSAGAATGIGALCLARGVLDTRIGVGTPVASVMVLAGIGMLAGCVTVSWRRLRY